MRTPRRLFLAIIALLASFTLTPRTGWADVGPPDHANEPAFAGTFRYAGDAREDAERHAAIDRGVDSLFFAIRPIARWRLAEATRVIPWFSVSFAPGKIRTRGAEGLDVSTPTDGGSVPYSFRGEKYRVATNIRGPVLVQTMIADEGAGRNEWTLSPDGSTLTCKVTITSSHLPVPIVFHLTYKRAT